MSEATTLETQGAEPAVDEQPYDWNRCTVRLSIIFHPIDESEGGRPVTLGCNTHRDPPLFESIREAELGTLPPAIAGLLENLKQRLPQRAEIAESRRRAEAEAEEKRKLERQQAMAKVQAARQKSHRKNNQRQTPSPAPAGDSSQAQTLFDLGTPSPAKQGETAVPVTGKQPSLFD
jgi:hypothetical protein